jgi:hypothetical protein
MLSALYGGCRVNHSFPWPAQPEAYAGTDIGDALRQIRAALVQLRGHRDFIKSPVMPPCDYVITDPLCIVEFDESQHFSGARLAALRAYPGSVALGFSLERWQQLCSAIDARDDTPIDRDERRAWYDSLRDLLPALHGFRPTIRLYAADIAWCSLNRASPEDRRLFKNWVEQSAPSG